MTATDRKNVFMFAAKRTLVDCSVLFKFYSANVKKLKIVFFRDIILIWHENFEINDTQLTWNVEGLKLQPIMLVDIFI